MQQDDKLKKLISGRQSQLEKDKSNWIDRMQDVSDYVIPYRGSIIEDSIKGANKGTKIYDGTAPSAAVLAADGIHGYHVSPAFPWFKYSMSRKDLNKNKEVRLWLEEIEFAIYSALNRSNFYSEMWSFIYDGFTIATATIYPEEDIAAGKIVFETVHPGEIYIAENKYNEVDVLHRKRKVSARKLVSMFGINNLPESVKYANENQPFQEFELIHAVYPREDFDSRLKIASKKEYASVWMLSQNSHVCRVSGFDNFPYNIWRYFRMGRDVYGISPAHLAMADIKGVNLIAKTLQGAAQLAIDPAYNVPSYMQGKVQLKPRGLNYTEDGSPGITPINTGNGYQVGLDREQAKQMSIKKRFHVDTFLMLSQMESQRTQKTAYEVSEMMAEKAAILGAELCRLNTCLDKILEQVFDIETKAGRIPPPPDIILEMSNKDPALRFDPVYQGVLAQAQKEKFGKSSIQKFFTDVAPLIQIDPEVLDNFDLDAAAKILADVDGLPAMISKDQDAVTKTRQARQQMQQEQQQKENAMDATQGLKTVSEADKNMGGKLSAAIDTNPDVQQTLAGQAGARP